MTSTLEEQIEAAIDAWHGGAGGGMELHEYLGWTWEEYAAWARDPTAIPAHKQDTNHAE